MKIYTVAPQQSASVPRLTPVEADLGFPAPQNHLTFERTNRASSGKGLLLLMLPIIGPGKLEFGEILCCFLFI